MTTKTSTRTLLLALTLLLFGGAALTAFGGDAPTAAIQGATLDVAPLEATSGSICGAIQTSPTLFEIPPVLAAKDGCSNSSCDASCRAQGFDYGVCFQTFCICRFWLP